MKAFFLQGSWEPLFLSRDVNLRHFCPFWTKKLDYALGAEIFCMFALGAEAAFYWCLGVSLLFIMKVKVSNRGQGQK